MRLRVLTLNCWGLPLFARDRAARMAAIGEALAQMDLDVVGLQELYDEDDQRLVTAGASRGGLAHSRTFPSGVIGSGLLLLSRFPIREESFLRFRLSGRPQELIRADYYAGKGLARLRLETPAGLLDVYDTHMIAGYGEIGSDIYVYHRLAQAYELARHVCSCSPDVPAIVTGDLNTTPGHLAYRVCTGLGRLTDSFWAANPGDPGVTVTTDIPYVLVHEPERIDYILCRDGPAQTLRILASEVTLTSAPPGAGIRAYSDHYGVCTTFELALGRPERPLPEVDASVVASVRQSLEEGVQQVHCGQRAAKTRASLAGLASIALLVAQGDRRISRRAFLRGLMAASAVVLWLAAGVTLSLDRQLSKEERILRGLLDEVRQHYPL